MEFVDRLAERPLKQFLAATAREVRKLDRALCALDSEITVVLMHDVPVVQSRVQGSWISLLDEMTATLAELSTPARRRACSQAHRRAFDALRLTRNV